MCLGNISGSIYNVLIAGGIVGTKHVRSFERQFPGLSLIYQESEGACENSSESNTDSDDGFAEVSIGPDSEPFNDTDSSENHGDENDGDSSDDDNFDNPFAGLTHIPEVPSTYREKWI